MRGRPMPSYSDQQNRVVRDLQIPMPNVVGLGRTALTQGGFPDDAEAWDELRRLTEGKRIIGCPFIPAATGRIVVLPSGRTVRWN